MNFVDGLLDIGVASQEYEKANHQERCGNQVLFSGVAKHYLGRITEYVSNFSALDTWAESRKPLTLQRNYSFLPR
jgi:hypothetical protein